MSSMEMIPLCWKCSESKWRKNRTKNVVDQRMNPKIFVGCKKCAKIKSWDDAKKDCPLLDN